MALLHDIVSHAAKNNPNETAVIFDDSSTVNAESKCIRLTYDELWERIQEIKTVLANFVKHGQIITVLLPPYCDLPCILISILSSRCTFFPISFEGFKYCVCGMKKVQASWVLVHTSLEQEIVSALGQSNVEVISDDVLLKFQIKLIKLLFEPQAHASTDCDPLAYCITTSGTTSSPKVVKVPHSCIVPNILSLRKIFDAKPGDKMLLSSPLTFDPCMIDIFVTLSSGATLLIVPDEVKLNPGKLLHVIYARQKATILQATPTLVSRFSPHRLQKTILGADSPLRLLAFGGEQFPSGEEMKKWVHSNNKTRFLNLYGITEVSCWASCEEVNIRSLIESNRPVPVGKPLDKTLVKLSSENSSNANEGNILIGSAERVCIIDTDDVTGHMSAHKSVTALDLHTNEHGDVESNKVIWRDSGDRGRLMPNGSIVYLGRKDDQIKRNGKRLNTSTLEEVCCQVHVISDCKILQSQEKTMIAFVIMTDDQTPMPQSNQRSENEQLSQEKLVGLSAESKHNLQSSARSGEIQRNGEKMTEKETERTMITDGVLKHSFQRDSRSRWEAVKAHLMDHIKLSLPSHYMPDFFVEVSPAFPITKHGKLDKKSLLKMASEVQMDERLLFKSPDSWASKLWLDYLPAGIEKIMAEDNFVSLGGDSLTAVGLINVVEKIIKEPATEFLDILFDKSFHHFVEKLKMHLQHESSHKAPLETANVDREIESHHDIDKDSLVQGSDEEKHVSGTFKITSNHTYTEGKGTSFHHAEKSKLSQNLQSCSIFHENATLSSLPPSESMNDLKVISRGNRILDISDSHQENQAQLLHQSNCQDSQPQPDNTAAAVEMRFASTHCSNCSPVGNSLNLVSTPGGAAKSEDPCLLSQDKDKEYGMESTQRKLCCLKLIWKYDTGKCVDASPTIAVFGDKTVVFTGSHSGHFCALDLNSGNSVWTVTLPDRIESSACCSKDLKSVVVGCYDGGIYSLDISSGSVEWCFKTEDIVKCSPSVDKNSGHVICGSHDGNVYCLDVESKMCVWKKFLGGSVLASPLINNTTDIIYVASMRGKILALKCNNGESVWCLDLKKPVFSSPCFHNSSILIGCIDNTLYSISDNGVIEWKFKTEGPIFSSPISVGSSITFGCHDCRLYCLTSEGQLKWSCKLNSTVFSTPFIVHFQNGPKKPEDYNDHIKYNTQTNLSARYVSSSSLSSERSLSQTSNETHDKLFMKSSSFIKTSSKNIDHSVSSNVNEDTGITQEPLKKIARYCYSQESPSSHKELLWKPFSSVENVNPSQLESEITVQDFTDVNATKISENQTVETKKRFDPGHRIDSLRKVESHVYNIIAASSSGTLYVVQEDNGTVSFDIKLPGEVFSSPVVWNNKVVVGCRDNFIYCYDFIT